MTARRVLVVGGSGFIGRRLVPRLSADGHSVVVTSLTSHGGARALDVGDEAGVDALIGDVRPDVVVNLAVSRALDDRPAMDRVNATGVGHLLDSARRWGVDRFVHVASSSEVGRAAGRVDDDVEHRPASSYGASKNRGTQAVLAAGRRGGPVAVLRCFYVYGPDERTSRLIPTALAAAASGDVLPLTAPGFGRDYVFVDDVADALARTVGAAVPPGWIANVASGVSTTNEAVVNLVERITGRAVRRRVGGVEPRDWDLTDQHVSIVRAGADLGWRPTVDLATGIRHYLEDR